MGLLHSMPVAQLLPDICYRLFGYERAIVELVSLQHVGKAADD
jgi:hypothetical protein